ncbi:4Fe-4S binding protein [Thalassotalea piscium]|uniref:Polyferredoxin n=1 Tax=Thalassotalea piscium TaxID=1230533 RepID=A0A7X0TSI7_9GAMM|nr:4Fe-4S binding protein [Thalassotalea piscium]MBB6542188.1 polyferredoxin [Thalassotalea piscium]
MTLQQSRVLAKTLFFLLFLFAPLLNIFRFDLALGHFIIFGQAWTISIDSILYDGGDSVDAAIKIFSRVLLPGMAFVAISAVLIWKYGRIYCGWLCPHFSVVELINDLMLKQLNRVTVWEKASKASKGVLPKLVVSMAAISMAFIWALGLLSYLLNPQQLLLDLINANLGFGASIFIIVATTVFTLDFLFARHLFCKYGCALGLFQSLIWMANKRAMVVKFDRKRAKACRECSLNQDNKPCDQACPMRLPTRNMKRAKFTCTQCAQCISACEQVQKDNPEGSLLTWVSGAEAVEVDRPAGQFKRSHGELSRLNAKIIDVNVIEKE